MRYARGKTATGVQHIIREDGGRESWNPNNTLNGRPRALCSRWFFEAEFDPEVRVCDKCATIRAQWVDKAIATIRDYA